MKDGLNRITKGLLYVCLGVGMVFFASLPWTMPVVLLLPDFAPEGGARYYLTLVSWLIATGLVDYILYTLILMMNSLSGDPFIPRNVARLRRMGIAALVMGGFLCVSALLYPRPMLYGIAAAACMCGLFSLVLRGVFAKAVEYREENALTI